MHVESASRLSVWRAQVRHISVGNMLYLYIQIHYFKEINEAIKEIAGLTTPINFLYFIFIDRSSNRCAM